MLHSSNLMTSRLFQECSTQPSQDHVERCCPRAALMRQHPFILIRLGYKLHQIARAFAKGAGREIESWKHCVFAILTSFSATGENLVSLWICERA